MDGIKLTREQSLGFIEAVCGWHDMGVDGVGDTVSREKAPEARAFMSALMGINALPAGGWQVRSYPDKRQALAKFFRAVADGLMEE